MRTYTTNEGKLPNLEKRFSDHTMGLFEKHGIENLIYWTPLDKSRKSNTLVYIISHESRNQAKANWDGFRNDAEWKRVAKESQIDGKILAKSPVSVFMTETDFSTSINKPGKHPGFYELRQYTTAPGCLPQLERRVREHNAHHASKQTAAYYIPTDTENTLIAIEAHSDRKSAQKSGLEHNKETQWKGICEAPMGEQKIVRKMERQELKLTDFSPLR